MIKREGAPVFTFLDFDLDRGHFGRHSNSPTSQQKEKQQDIKFYSKQRDFSLESCGYLSDVAVAVSDGDRAVFEGKKDKMSAHNLLDNKPDS